MEVTKKLLLLDNTLELHEESEYSNSSYGFKAFNNAGVECEVGELLYSLVRILKPENVLETGTHEGIGSSYMALALKENYNENIGHTIEQKKPKLDTVEFIEQHYQTSKARFARMGLSDYINQYLIDAKLFNTQKQYKLILLDTEPQTRFAEMIKFYDNLEMGGFLFIHDLHRHMGQVDNAEHGFGYPFGELPYFIKSKVKHGILRPIHFSTPRGLAGFYKKHESDFDWR